MRNYFVISFLLVMMVNVQHAQANQKGFVIETNTTCIFMSNHSHHKKVDTNFNSKVLSMMLMFPPILKGYLKIDF